jgi:polysaccharide pyruvyl transferase WcaK-like protein
VAGTQGPLVYLVGTAGHPHYGDEVVTACWLRYYAQHMPDAEVWLDTPRPGQTAVLHGGSHPRLRCVDTLYHACWNAPTEQPSDCVDFGAAVVDEPGRLPREASGVSALARASVVHILGGGYINAIWPRHLTLLGAARRVAERTGAGSALTGAALTPASEAAAPVLADVLATFDVVDCRDAASSDLVAPGVPHRTQTGDDALVDLQRQPITRRDQPAAVVEVQSDLIDRPLADLADEVVALLRQWGRDEGEVLLLESLPPTDLAVAELLTQRLPHVQVRPFEMLWRDGFPMVNEAPWITTRFHTHLMAAAAGAWGVALAASSAIAAQHDSLIALGSGWATTAGSSTPIPMGAPSLRPFADRFADLVADKTAVAHSVLALARR